MKANLAQREPDQLKRWEAMGLYERIRAARAGAEQFILHDGPPYANGEIHIGHAVNKVLKDIIVKSRTLDGMDAPYVPGWDCHGLPIELQVEKKKGKPGQKISAVPVPRRLPRLCRNPGRAPADGLQAARGPGGLGPAVSDHGLRVRGRDHPLARPHRRERTSAKGREAGPLVHRLRLRAGGGRGGVRGQTVHRGGRAIRGAGPRGPGGPLPRLAQRLRRGPGPCGDLDHHALDPARQPGGRPQPGARVRHRPGGDRRPSGAPDRRRGPAQGHHAPLGLRALPGHGLWARRGLRGAEAPASLLRSGGAGDPGRARDPGCRHRRGAHGPGPRPGGLHRRPALPAPGGQPGGRRRPLPARNPAVRGRKRVQGQRARGRDPEGPRRPAAGAAIHP